MSRLGQIYLHRGKTRLLLIGCMVLLLVACNPARSAKDVTPIAAPTSTAYSSAPQDASLDFACRETINFFLSYKQGDDHQAYRDLFTPSSQYLADAYVPPAEALILLELMPASQEWQRDFPGTPMPGSILPEGPNEYTYYIKVTGYYGHNGIPAYTNTFPDSMTMHMVVDDPYSCKIKSFGKG